MADDNDREQPDIDLSLDDLDEEPLPPAGGTPAPRAGAPAPRGGGDMLVINSHDLLDISDEPAGTYPAPTAYPGVEPGAYAPLPKAKKGVLAGGIVGSLLLQMALAGALGGILAWAINEPVSYLGDTGGPPENMGKYVILVLAIATAAAAGLGMGLGFSQWSGGGAAGYFGPILGLVVGAVAGACAAGIGWLWSHGYAPSEQTAVLHTTMFAAIIGSLTGLCIGLVDGIYSGNIRKMLIGGAIGLGAGVGAGAIGGLFAQIIYGFLTPQGETLSIRQIFARTIGWGIAGLAVGLGLGIAHGLPAKSVKKIVNGIMGGAIGGFAGGFMFDPLGMVLGGLGSRLLAITLIGGLSGAAIGLIEELRKQAWLAVVGGPLTGKQFILYNQVTTIGSSPKCDIALLKDPHIAPQHCVIEVSGATYQLRDLGAGTLLNGRPIQRQALRAGDVIQIGGTSLEYEDRALTAGDRG